MPRPAQIQPLLEKFLDKNHIVSLEGRRGIIGLARVARAIGYKDPTYFGQIEHNATIGDLIMFLEDNSGAIASIIEWIGTQRSAEWEDLLKEQVEDDEEA